MKRLLLPALPLLLLIACSSPEKPPANNEPAPPARQPTPEKAAVLGTLEDPENPEQQRAIALIEKITGRKFKDQVPVYVYTPEELEEEVSRWEGYRPDNLMGFYRFDTKALYLVPEKAGNKRAFGLRIHEACHALQDQLYDLTKIHESAKTTDENWAILGLIEGEAVQVMIDALIEKQPHVAYIAKARAPEGSRDPDAYRVVYTYAAGTRFIQHLKKRGGYDAVHKAFGNLPASSEQILHPEKYDVKRDAPDRITLDRDAIREALPEGWKVRGYDTLGEFETRLWFIANEATFARAEELAAGWGGDAYVEARRPGDKQSSLRVWVSTWDTRKDAEEFCD